MPQQKVPKLYLFLDESGNFIFSPKGTQFLVFTCISTSNPFPLYEKLNGLKNSLLESGEDIEYFHATEDKQEIRNRVYEVLNRGETGYDIDSIIVEKPKANPVLYEPPKLYLKAYECLLKYVFQRYDTNKIIIFTDLIPHQEKRENIKKGLKEGIRKIFGRDVTFYIYHHASKSHFCLQAVDYCSWAIYRKYGDWGDKELRPYNTVKKKIRSEFDYFQGGTEIYYNRGWYYNKQNPANAGLKNDLPG